MVKYIGLLLTLLLVSCDSYYRYPCQNPSNWDKDMCKKPWCEIDRTCPEHIFKEDTRYIKECK